MLMIGTISDEKMQLSRRLIYQLLRSTFLILRQIFFVFEWLIVNYERDPLTVYA